MRALALPVLRCDTPRCGRAFVALAPGLCNVCVDLRRAVEDAKRAEHRSHWTERARRRAEREARA